jgi:hypothetical protein
MLVVARFLENYAEWFDFDYEKGIYVPKEGTPKEALELYKEYVKAQEKADKHRLI